VNRLQVSCARSDQDQRPIVDAVANLEHRRAVEWHLAVGEESFDGGHAPDGAELAARAHSRSPRSRAALRDLDLASLQPSVRRVSRQITWNYRRIGFGRRYRHALRGDDPPSPKC
jgi:hypothetical protein